MLARHQHAFNSVKLGTVLSLYLLIITTFFMLSAHRSLPLNKALSASVITGYARMCSMHDFCNATESPL